MDVTQFYLRSLDIFGSKVEAIRDDQWHDPTPCTEWDVRDLVNHLVSEDLWATPMLAGKTIADVGDAFEGDLLGDDPKAAWREAAGEGRAAVSAPGALEATVHASFGDISGEHYLSQLFTDHVIHAWDLARAIGADEMIDPGLAQIIYDIHKPIEDQLKASGAFGDRIDVSGDADLQTKLLGVFGRRA